MTREEIIEIEQYCSDHKVGKKSRLAELGIPFWNFYRARRKYQREAELIGSAPSAGNFIQLATLPSGPALQPSKRMIRQKFRKDAGPIVESYLTIELRTAHRYWFYNRPVNMRLGFNGLSGIVTNRMGMNLTV